MTDTDTTAQDATSPADALPGAAQVPQVPQAPQAPHHCGLIAIVGRPNVGK